MHIFLNMDISIIISLKMCIHVTKVCMEGSVSQNFDLGLSFGFMLCRRWNFEENGKKYQKFLVFLS